MSEKNHKIEVRHGTWHVTLSHGEYSDYRENHLFFAANSAEEVWHMLKQFADEGGLGDNRNGLIYDGNRHQYGKLPDWKDEITWETGYGDAEGVKIEPLELIFVNPK